MLLRFTKITRRLQFKVLVTSNQKLTERANSNFLYTSNRLFSSVGSKNDSSYINFDIDYDEILGRKKEPVTPSPIRDTSELLVNKYATTFDSRHPNSIYDIREGGYLNIEPDVAQKFFPEGFAGEMETEFDLAYSKSWMMRMPTKILCRILDEYAIIHANKRSIPPAKIEGGSFVPSRINLPGYTDGPPLRSSIVQAQHYGTELLNSYEPIGKLRGSAPVYDCQTNNINEYMKKIKDAHGGSIPLRTLLTGYAGSGRSTCLNQAVLHARQTGWLVLFIPNGWSHVQEGPFVEPVRLDSGEQVFDNSVLSSETLRGFLKAHQHTLSQLPIKNKAALKKYQPVIDKFKEEWMRTASMPGRENSTFLEMRRIIEGDDHIDSIDSLDTAFLKKYDFLNLKLETLEDLVLFGIAFRNTSAGLVFIDLVSELKAIEHTPFLIAVDAYNTWEVPSAFHYDNVPIPAKKICVPYALQFLNTRKSEQNSWQMNNGVCFGTVSGRKVEGRKLTYREIKRSIPFALHVPNYSSIEFLSAAVHYMKSNYFPRDADSSELLSYRLHCASNPKLVRDESITFLTPLDLMKGTDHGPIDAPLIDKFGDDGKAPKSSDRGSSGTRELTLKELEMQLSSVDIDLDGNDILDEKDDDVVGKKKKSKLPISKAKGKK